MAFHLYTSNDVERLAAKMSSLLDEARRTCPSADPFYTETVVINSRGMESWLLQQLAAPKNFGGDTAGIPRIQANIRFAMPNALLNFGLEHLDGKQHAWDEAASADTDLFDRSVLAWRIYDILGRTPEAEDAFAALRSYIGGAGADANRRRFQLAREVADVFDQYEVHRPEMLDDWRRGRETTLIRQSLNAWQPQLWRLLTAVKAMSRDQQIARYCANQQPVRIDSAELARVWVFGISTIAPCYLAFLRKLGDVMPVHLFVRNPSPDYWFEDMARSRIERSKRVAVERGDDPDEMPMQAGDPLLSSFGQLIQDFLDEILDQTGGSDADTGGLADPSDNSLFSQTPPAAKSLLGSLQRGIFCAGNSERVPAPLADDRSLVLHSCHSHMREIEVLRDQLLAWFDDDTVGPDTKLPRHVVVMAPDIEEYVPAIEAIFNRKDRAADDYIPYTIADRTTAAESAVVQSFLALLTLPTMRFKASEIFDLLGVDAVATACGLSEADINQLQRWSTAANIRWGLDADQRDGLGFAALGTANSWEMGIDRLFAGYAMADSVANDDCALLFDGIAPYNEVEGGSAALLGRMAQFVDDLRVLRSQFKTPRTASDWCAHLTGVLDRFFVGDNDTYADIATIRKTLEQMAEHIAAAGIRATLPLAVIESHVNSALRTTQSSSLFCRGRITFCSLLPMRSIPADFIWLLGMNDNAFPRQDPRRDFNLIHSGPRRRCDRSRRLDDRYMFLEAIISARYRLHISYHGRSNQDNSPRPPSAVVRELQSVIATELEAVTIEHPLHIFSKLYFSADPDEKRDLFTFSATAHAAATNLYDGGPRLNPLLFADGALAQPPDANSPLWNPSPELMARFFTSPPAFIMRQRLGLYLGSDSERVLDSEPIDLGTLAASSLKQRIVDVACPLVYGKADEQQVQIALDAFCIRLQAEGAVAVGKRGTRWIREEWENATQYLSGPLEIDTYWADVPQARLADLMQAITDKHPPAGIHLQQRFSGVKAKDKVQALVRHICGQVAADSHGLTVLTGWNKKFETYLLYPATSDDSREQLHQDYDWLLALYRLGLSQPLPFVPRVSFAYGDAWAGKDENTAKAEVAADKAWFGDTYAPAYDGLESAPNRYCFGTDSLLGAPGFGVHFEDIAKRFHAIWKYWEQARDRPAAGDGDV